MPKLSDTIVAALTCPPGKKDILVFDGMLPGFGVRVTAQGNRIFLLQYRYGVKVRRMVLGSYGEELTTTQARSKAQIRLGEVRDGKDPEAERRAKRTAAVLAESESKRADAEAAFTFRRLAEGWEHLHLVGMRPSYRADAVGRINLHLATLLDRPAGAITKTDAVTELDRIAKAAGDTTARRVMGYARSAYGWARKRGSVAVNPFEGLPPIGREISRDRVLTAEEIAAIWKAAGQLPPVHGSFVRFLMLTLARRDEVTKMRWSEVAPDRSRWTIPSERSKNGRAHVVHLAGPAQALLADLTKLDGDGLVFATGPGKALTTFSWMVRQIQASSGTAGWRLHDFRRTGVTVLAGLGFPPHVCDRLLNHVTGAIQGVAAVYQRAEFLAERKSALEAWAASVGS